MNCVSQRVAWNREKSVGSETLHGWRYFDIKSLKALVSEMINFLRRICLTYASSHLTEESAVKKLLANKDFIKRNKFLITLLPNIFFSRTIFCIGLVIIL